MREICPVNKIFPAVNLAFILTIALLVTLSVKTWTHPIYPQRVDGSAVARSPKNLQKLDVSKPAYNAGAISRIVQANLFRKERNEFISTKSPSAKNQEVPKSTLPPPNLVLKGVLILGGIKNAFLEGDYSTLEDGKVIQKKVQKKNYSLGQIVGDFELIKIEKSEVILDDKKGQKIRLPLSTRPAEKAILRKGNSLFQKKKKAESLPLTPAKTNSPSKIPAKAKSPSKTSTETNSTTDTPVPVFRLSGAISPPPAEVFPPQVHISGQ